MTTHLFWDEMEDNVSEEFDENGNTTAAYTTEPTLYGSVLSQDRRGEKRYFQFDGIGNTTALTDELGAITDTMSCTAFGEFTSESNVSVTPFRYCGRYGYYLLSDVHCHIVRQRTYVTRPGRWMTLDDLEIESGDMNLYEYVENSPVLNNDPSGQVCTRPKATGLTYVSGRGNPPPGYPAFGNPSFPSALPPPFQGVNPKPTYAGVWPFYVLNGWTPSPSAFHDSAEGCCCCSSVGWAQIYRWKSKSTGFFGWIPPSKDTGGKWSIDGGLPYPGGINIQSATIHKTANPCAQPAMTIHTWDRPNIKDVSGITLQKWEFDAETCVICLKGVEGPRTVYDVASSPIEATHTKGYVAYGCMRWGFTAKRKKGWNYLVGWHTHPWQGPKETAAWTEVLTVLLLNWGA